MRVIRLLPLGAMVLMWVCGFSATAQTQLGRSPVLNRAVSAAPAPNPLAQFRQGSLRPVWKADAPVMARHNPARTWQAPQCETCVYDEHIDNLPFIDIRVPAQPGTAIAVANSGGRYTEEPASQFAEPVNLFGQHLFAGGEEWYPAQPVVVNGPYTEQRQTYYQVRIYPMQVHRSGRMVRKYEEVTWTPGQRPQETAANKTARTYASQSVLATGQWVRLAITEQGLYRLDRSALASLGFNVNGLAPRSIRVFHNGPGIVPQPNAVARYDDLQENPILVTGEQDGTFDDGDQVVFYAHGPGRWFWNQSTTAFEFQPNYYTDTNYVYLNVGTATGLRVAQSGAGPGGGVEVRTTPAYSQVHLDNLNIQSWGKLWVMDEFGTSGTRNYTVTVPGLATGTNVRLKIRAHARGVGSTSFQVRRDGQAMPNLTVSGLGTSTYGCYYCRYAYAGTANYSIPQSGISNDQFGIEMTYSGGGGTGGWVDYLLANYSRALRVAGSALSFYATPIAGQPNQRLVVENSTGYAFWDVTHPNAIHAVPATPSGGDNSLDLAVDTFRAFVAVPLQNLSALPVPAGSLNIGNQNLHGLVQADYLIITHPAFQAAADRLANFHRTQFGRTVHVVQTTQVFNEFGCGRPDVSAMRDFVKMFYDRALTIAEMPKYVCLIGDGTYDLRGHNPNIAYENFVPLYPSYQSLISPEAFCSDDLLTYLDDNEGTWGEDSGEEWDSPLSLHVADLAIGRLPARTLDEAMAMVEKIENYVTGAERFGEWRSHAMFAADYKEGENMHMAGAELMASTTNTYYPCFKVDKVYLAATPPVSTGSGYRFPVARDEFLRQLDRGQLLVNYTGHGGEQGISSGGLFDLADIARLNNEGRTPLWITATCEWGRFDDPRRQCGAEFLAQRGGGGAVSVVTAVRTVYVSGNDAYNSAYLRALLTFNTNEQRYTTFGEALRTAKNQVLQTNSRNFTLLGDPGLPIGIPVSSVAVTEINNTPFPSTPMDTLRALSNVTLRGEIRTQGGVLDSLFTGEVFITILDKSLPQNTLISGYVFQNQKAVLFNGLASVTNGRFSLSFVVPLDISYQVGTGKLVMYAQTQTHDALGCTQEFIICCTDSNGAANNTPPTVQLFMNDEQWVAGGFTEDSPWLIANCWDDQGINTTGLGVGRELVAVLNGDEANPVILNEYYQTKKDSANQGQIRYHLRNLEPGSYTARVQVWDVSNNPAQDETHFIVSDNAALALENVLNYPNPFTTTTQFFLNHNRPGEDMDVLIQIFSVSGRLVKTLQSSFTSMGNIVNHIDWDGLDDYGDRIGRGTYIYKVSMRVPRTGEQVAEFQKLVLLR